MNFGWRNAMPFGLADLVWLAAAGAIAQRAASPEAQTQALLWFWGLATLSLLALARLMDAVFRLLSDEAGLAEKRAGLIIQASYWGMIKLACWGFIILGLLASGTDFARSKAIGGTDGANWIAHVGRSIGASGMKGHLGIVLGLATVGVVPLLGGGFWSLQRRFGQDQDASRHQE